MTTTLILSIASFLFIVFMFLNKQRETRTGRNMVKIGNTHVDYAVRRMYVSVSDKVHSLHPSNSWPTIRRGLLMVEKSIMNVFYKLGHKFSIVGEVVTGRDIPKNKGAVSFFLKNIESSKKKGTL